VIKVRKLIITIFYYFYIANENQVKLLKNARLFARRIIENIILTPDLTINLIILQFMKDVNNGIFYNH